MNIKKSLLLALPLLGVVVGGLTAFSSKKASVVEAADYSTTGRCLKIASDGSVTVTLTVTGADFDLMEGWLLCLFKNKPSYDANTRKLIDSADLHPYSLEDCAHYFYALSSDESGEFDVTWDATATDQKENWSSDEEGETGEQLKDCFEAEDWYIVIGPRHWEQKWPGGDNPEEYDIGEGLDHIWENCDYYVGQKNALLNGKEGQTYLDLSQSNWENAGAKFGFYYFNSNNNGWSEGFATKSEFDHIYQAQYSLDFVPTKMIAVRFNNNADTLRWNSYDGEDYVLAQSLNEDFIEFAVSGVTGDNNNPDYWSYEMASVKFSENDKVPLDHLKRNSFGNSENFNQGFPLTEGQTFDIEFGGTTYSTFEINDSLASKIDIKSVSGKVKVLEDGIYALYFNTDTHSLYITTTALAEADEWSLAFLGEDCTNTKSLWSNFGGKYNNLSGDAKDVLKSEPHVAHDVIVTRHVALAMQRYDFLVENFEGYYDFIGRELSQSITPHSLSLTSSNLVDDSTLIVVIAASISLITLAALVVIKKKRAK